MAANPAFAATPLHGVGLTPATLDTSLTAPTHVTTIVASQTNGCKIEEIDIQQVATTSGGGIVNIFIFDGASYWLWDQYTFTALTLSTTVEATLIQRFYPNLIIPTGSTLVVTTTVAAGQSAWCVHAWGGAY